MALLNPRHLLMHASAVAASLVLSQMSHPVAAQSPSTVPYHLLDPNTAPGVAGQWSATLAQGGMPEAIYFQPIRFELPSQGQIAVCSGSAQDKVSVAAPAQLGLAVGRTYRVKISQMPEFPGLEFYPTLEILDRLHPPSGREEEFPVPVDFTQEEIELALQGSLVTRVIYLEQPQLAAPISIGQPVPARTLPAHANILAEADQLGRPMAIVRLGGRLPIAGEDETRFFGPGAPISNLRSLAAPSGPTSQHGSTSE